MDVSALLLEIYGRIPPLAAQAVEGLDPTALTRPPREGANTIAWLIWHTARVQDHHVAEVLGEEQLWTSRGWAGRFGLDPEPSNTGYGHSSEEIGTIRPESAAVLLDYLDAVDRRTRVFIEGLEPADLDGVVDRRWDPPVTLGVRLASIADDSLQHVGQAAYARGLLSG